jgi:DNA-binding transcriptional ArsR family regulator
MGSPQTLTQRLVPALAVTLVATLVLGAVVVTADVADGTEPMLPQWFTVAVPMQGDAWRYNVTLSGDWTFGGEDDIRLGKAYPFGTYQWAGAATVRGGDGLMHDANYLFAEHLAYEPGILQAVDEDEDCEDDEEECLEEAATGRSRGDEGNASLVPSESPYWSEAASSGWVLAGGRNVISRGEMSGDSYNDTDYGFPTGPVSTGLGSSYFGETMQYGFIEYPTAEVPCLVFNPLQGNNVSLAGEVGLFDACTLGDAFFAIPDGLSFRATAVETIGDVQAIRFDGHHNGTYRAWFTPAVPYPVRISFQLAGDRPAVLEEGDLDLPGDRSAVLDLVGFQAGSAPLDVVDDPADPDPAPSFAMAPQQAVVGIPAGPDEAGITHPFPLSVALQKASEEPTFQNFDVYLDGAGDPYVQSAHYWEGQYAFQGPTSTFAPARVWSIVLTDGINEPFAFEAAQQTYDSYLPVAARGTANQPQYFFQQGYGGYGYYYGHGYGSDEAPRASQIPQAMPTVQSLFDRWSAFDGSSLPANSWGFSIVCAPDVEPCKPQVELSAGHLRDERQGGLMGPLFYTPFPMPGDPYGNETEVRVTRVAYFDLEGTAAAQVVDDYRSWRSAGPITGMDGDGSPFIDDPQSDPGYDVQSTQVTGIPSSGLSWVPEPKEAAGIGFMGIVIGALYWIWPKLGMVGLFSRLDRGELLDHPARAKLVQIVESQPGIHFHDLAQKAELANGTAVHHLRKLSDSGHLSVRRSGRYTCYFPGGRVDPHAAAAAPLLKSDGAKQVLEAVRAKPGMSNLEVAQATGLQPSTVNYHVQRLAAAGLLAALRDGRNVRLHPGIRAGGEPPAAAAS